MFFNGIKSSFVCTLSDSDYHKLEYISAFIKIAHILVYAFEGIRFFKFIHLLSGLIHKDTKHKDYIHI